MENLTLGQLVAAALTIASAFVLLSNAGEKIAKFVSMVKKPNNEQNVRIEALEEDMAEIKRKLNGDRAHLEKLDEGNRVIQKALLALLDHGIDGNNIAQMEDAKAGLCQHLIDK